MDKELIRRCRAEMNTADYAMVADKYLFLAKDEETKKAIREMERTLYHLEEARCGME